jgi:aspartyl protease
MQLSSGHSHSRLLRPLRALPLLGALGAALACLFALAGCTIQLGSYEKPSTGPGITVHVQVVHGQEGATLLMLPVKIQNKGPYNFALDTGASSSLVDKTLATQLGLKQVGPAQPIAGIGSRELATPVRVPQWSVDSLKLPPATIASAALFNTPTGPQLQGLLGSDVWDQFGTITIDYTNGTLTVKKQIAWFAPPQALAWRRESASAASS